MNADPGPDAAATSAHGWPVRPAVPHDVALRLLTEGEVEVIGRMPWSSNATFLVDLVAGDDRLVAVYKPRRGERPLWDFPVGSLCRRELAAYEVSEMFGWGLVPETVIRDGPAGEGSIQRFIDHDPEDHYFSLLERDENAEALRRFAAFDIVANNTDRKAGHVIRDADGHLWGIDHGVCFHEEWKVRTVIWDFGGERLGKDVCGGLERCIRQLEGPGAGRLERLLSAGEIAATLGRARWLLETAHFPAVDPGHHSYPWPLV